MQSDEKKAKPTLELSRKATEMQEIINCCFSKPLSFRVVCYAPIDNRKSNCLPYVCTCIAQKHIKIYSTIKCTFSPCRFPFLALNLYEVPLLKDSPPTTYNITLLHTPTVSVAFLIAATKCLTKATEQRELKDTIDRSGESTAGTWSGWSCCVHTKESKKEECWHSACCLFICFHFRPSPWTGSS